ncbi:MAG TPA: glycosyltransferase [Vicinamibacterales bacterium]|nr:glycosyltransferase [Vicinamibacterales bacterium]
MKLGIVYHMPFWRAADGTLREMEGSFARYVDSLAPYFDEIVLSVPVLDRADEDGTAIRAVNVALAPLPRFDGPLQFYPRLPLMLPRIWKFVRGVDLLHCRVPTPAAAFAAAAAGLLKRPTFLLVVGDLEALRDTVPYRGVKKALWDLYTAFEEANLRRMADGSLTFANGAALARKHSTPSRRAVETQTTTIAAADIAAREDACAGGRLRILTVSRIDPRKGLRVLPEVIAELRAQGLDASLDIVGPTVGAPGEAERQAIEARAAALGIGERLCCAGSMPLERLLPMYRDYDLFVLPTLPGEGIPRVLLEAMAAGVPIVTTRVAGIPSLIVDGRNGVLVDEPTPQAIAGALARLVANPALRRAVVAGGYDSARAHTLDAQAAAMMGEVASRLALTLRQPVVAPAA